VGGSFVEVGVRRPSLVAFLGLPFEVASFGEALLLAWVGSFSFEVGNFLALAFHSLVITYVGVACLP